jgi:hypothetical protein
MKKNNESTSIRIGNFFVKCNLKQLGIYES